MLFLFFTTAYAFSLDTIIISIKESKEFSIIEEELTSGSLVLYYNI